MKKLLIIFILLFPISLCAIERENFHGIRYDYLLHYETGFVSAIVIDQWNRGMFNIGEDYGLFSIGIPALMALAKEYSDFKSNDDRLVRETYKDFGYTILGAISGKFLSYTF